MDELAAVTEITTPDIAANQHKWLIAMAVMLGTVLEMIDTSIINVALPHMQGSFSASVDEITWVVTSYLVANGIMIPLTGWISARFGRKRYFLFSVTAFVMASACCGAARSLDQMVLFRLIQGFAGAAMLPSSQAIMMETFPPEEQQLAMATWSMGLMVAPVLGPTLGGWITDNWSWRWNFYINVPIGILAILMVYTFLEDPSYLRPKRGSKIDYLGIATLTVGLGLMQLVCDRGQRADWFSSPWVVDATMGSIAALALFTWRELTFPDPVVDVRILLNPLFAAVVVLVVVFSFAVYGANILNPIFLQEYLGYTAMKAGLTLSPRALASFCALILVGQLSRTGFNTRPLIGVAFLTMGVSTWMMSKWTLQVSPWQVIGPVMLNGVGGGLLGPQLSAISLTTVPRERMGYASSLFNMMRNTGAAVGISLLTAMLVAKEQVHQARLVEHISIFDAWRMSEAPARMPGSPALHFLPQMDGGRHGLAMIYGMVQAQAAILSFNDIYRMLSILAVAVLPIYLVVRKAPMSTAQAGH
ncbi:MAG TPA: DHA2 family efflux MFS transporter permease subunit [Candidatus Binataceae bacterium]|nr:DHA2 family efflux MFS transporter permease subunit [Candidatus Binataceae bacterium]